MGKKIEQEQKYQEVIEKRMEIRRKVDKEKVDNYSLEIINLFGVEIKNSCVERIFIFWDKEITLMTSWYHNGLITKRNHKPLEKKLKELAEISFSDAEKEALIKKIERYCTIIKLPSGIEIALKEE